MTKRRSFSTVVKARTSGTTTVIASTPTPDRYDDVVAGGNEWRLEKYMANPVVQFGHRYDVPPVGKTTKLTTDKDGNLIATIKWDDSPTNPLGQTVAAQFRDGFMSAVSVGFQPTQSTPRNKLPSDHPAYGEKGMYFQGNQLLEISAVPVPANGEALALRSIGAEQIKSILSVEETDDTYVVTYAKYPPAEGEIVDDEDEAEEDGYGSDDLDDEEAQLDDEDDAPDDVEDDEDEIEDEAMEDDEDEDEEKSYRRQAFAYGSAGERMVLRSLVRDTIFELLGHDEQVRSILTPDRSTKRSRKSNDAVSSLFGIDK